MNILVVAGMEMFGSFAAMFFLQGNVWSFHNYMLYNWGSISSNSLQLDLSMLILTLMNWWSNRWKNSQYPTAGACLK